MWWQALEDIIAQQRGLAVEENGETQILTIHSVPQKRVVYDMLYAKMRAMPETDAARVVAAMPEEHARRWSRRLASAPALFGRRALRSRVWPHRRHLIRGPRV